MYRLELRAQQRHGGGHYPTAAPGTYVVREGDTLQTIAAALWGDSSLWYVLAEANGVAPNQPLIANTTLTVPNKVLNLHNNANTFKPYDAGEAIGHVNPTIPDPPPPPQKGKGCGGAVKIIAIVVAVAATIFTAGAAAVAMGATGGMFSAGLGVLAGGAGLGLSSVGAVIGAAAIGGAVGSLASQGVLIAGGVQDKIDWKGVGLGAVGAGVTAGLAGSTAMGNVVGKIGSGWGQAAASGAMNSAVTSGIGSVLDVSSFNWKSVAISAVAAGVGYGAGRLIGRMQYGNWGAISQETARADWGQTMTRNFGSGLAAGAASAAARGNLSGQVLTQIGLDALGSTVGNAIADGVAARSVASAICPRTAALSVRGFLRHRGRSARTLPM